MTEFDPYHKWLAIFQRGEDVIIVKQNHDRSDRTGRSWINLSRTSNGLLRGF